MGSKAAVAMAAAVAGLAAGCGHTDHDVSLTGTVTKLLGPGFCISAAQAADDCFNVRRDLMDGVHVGDCVTVSYIPSSGEVAPVVDEVESSTVC